MVALSDVVVKAARHRPGCRIPTPERLPSPNCFDEFFEIIVLINEDPFGSKRLPEKFAKYLSDREPVGVHLREATAAFAGCLSRCYSTGKATYSSTLVGRTSPAPKLGGRLLGELQVER
jgi:hypothetical protein